MPSVQAFARFDDVDRTTPGAYVWAHLRNQTRSIRAVFKGMTDMTRTSRLLFCIAAVALLAAQDAPQAQSQALVLRNVTLIDGTGAAAQPGVTVVVTGDRITDVGTDVPVPPQAQVVDGTGKFVIPGLWDMHIHIHRWDELVILLANGVTGVRLMAGLPEYFKMQAEIESGNRLGPRMAIASRNMDGLMPNQLLPPAPGDTAGEMGEWRAVEAAESIPRAMQVTTETQARVAMAQAKASGVEFVKIHNGLTRDAYFAIAEEAKTQGLYLTGHVQIGISMIELVDSGMRSVEHFGGMLEGCSSREDDLLKAAVDARSLPPAQRAESTLRNRRMAVETFSREKCAALAAHLVRTNTWLNPTFMPGGGIKEERARGAALAKYVPAGLRATWQQRADAAPEPASPSPEQQALTALVEANRLAVVAVMRGAGVGFLAGTDTGRPWRFSGFSLHDALAELNSAGLTPMEALQAATSNPARLLGREKEFGTIQTGMLADMVVLDADPLQQIANTRRINAVVVNGRLLDRNALDQMLAQLAATNAN
jgi:hypothetical protein